MTLIEHSVFDELPQDGLNIAKKPLEELYKDKAGGLFISLNAATLIQTVKHLTDVQVDQKAILKDNDPDYYQKKTRRAMYFIIGHQQVVSMLKIVRLLLLRFQNAWFNLNENGKEHEVVGLYGVIRVLHRVADFKEYLTAAINWLVPHWIQMTKSLLVARNKLTTNDQLALLKTLVWLEERWSFDFVPERFSTIRISSKYLHYPKKYNPSRLMRKILNRVPIELNMYVLAEKPLKIAIYLSLVQEQFFAETKWWELLKVDVWRKDTTTNKNSATLSISKVIHRSNMMCEWFIWLILLPPLIPGRRKVARADVINHLYLIALELYKLNNFDSLISLLLAVQHPVVTRMRKTWKRVPKHIQIAFGYLKPKKNENETVEPCFYKLCSPHKNWKFLRDIVNSRVFSNPIGIPAMAYFGLYTSDLILNEEAKSDFIKPTEDAQEMINLSKLMFRAKTVENYCIGCQGTDIFGKPLRSTYQKAFVDEIGFHLNLDVYRAFENFDFNLQEVTKSILKHPDVLKSLGMVGRHYPEKPDIWSISRLIEP